METSLHQQLKRCYAPDEASTEVVLGEYRIDAIRDDELIEIQCASLSAIRDKANKLLKRHSLRVVKPVVWRTRIAKAAKPGGPIQSSRMSPKRGNVLEVFEELIYFTRVFPHPNLVLEVPMVQVRETRIPSKRRRGRARKDYKVHDIELESIEWTHEFRTTDELLALLNIPAGTSEFITSDLASWIDRPRWVAQKIAYTLKHMSAIETVARRRSGIIYRCKTDSANKVAA
ncbi:hypothetical protein Pla52o_49020 [Novipirellula galeiformis]|uniref:DUF8091 domain-containing protein n=1 Tax=Novipirellula galeiformis TaxID=2528004 RepID=A0A5C6C137_9BACT|nr:hypothetical protein [Novipirellula galeiformis]TWU17687.1 hypothetical protein Pla52o_49020 [Novipirellula galeiformis]